MNKSDTQGALHMATCCHFASLVWGQVQILNNVTRIRIYQIFIPVACHRCHVLCHRRVSFPMGAYGSPTLKWTVCSGSFSRMSLLLWYSETNRSLLGSMFLIMYHFSIPDSHDDSPILFMSPGCTALSLWSPNCDGPVIIALLWKPWQGWEVGVGCVKCDLFWTVSWIYFADILLVRTSNLD